MSISEGFHSLFLHIIAICKVQNFLPLMRFCYNWSLFSLFLVGLSLNTLVSISNHSLWNPMWAVYMLCAYLQFEGQNLFYFSVDFFKKRSNMFLRIHSINNFFSRNYSKLFAGVGIENTAIVSDLREHSQMTSHMHSFTQRNRAYKNGICSVLLSKLKATPEEYLEENLAGNAGDPSLIQVRKIRWDG